MKITKKNRMVILLFLLPALVVYLVWVVWPIIEAIYMSMLKWETLNTTRFTGFDNYVSVFKSRLFTNHWLIHWYLWLQLRRFRWFWVSFMAIWYICSQKDTGFTKYFCLYPPYFLL